MLNERKKKVTRPSPINKSVPKPVSVPKQTQQQGDIDYDQYDALEFRSQESYRTINEGFFKDILDPGATSGIEKMKMSERDYLLDFIPYFAGTKDPNLKVKPGTPTYLVDIWVHRGVGPNDDEYICLAKNYNKRCPICEYREELPKNDENAETIKELRPKRRVLYWVWDRDNESKGIQLLVIAHWFMEAKIQAIAKKPRGGGYVTFTNPKAGPDGGRSVSFNLEFKGTNREYTGFQFVERDEPIPKHILDKARSMPIDELLYIPSYEEVHNAFFGFGSKVEPTQKDDKVAGDYYWQEQGTTPPFNTEELSCPFEGSVFGQDFGVWGECETCTIKVQCETEYANANPPEPVPITKPTPKKQVDIDV